MDAGHVTAGPTVRRVSWPLLGRAFRPAAALLRGGRPAGQAGRGPRQCTKIVQMLQNDFCTVRVAYGHAGTCNGLSSGILFMLHVHVCHARRTAVKY